MKKFTVIWLPFFTCFCLLVIHNECATSNNRLCGNADCSVPISRAKTLILYSSPKEGHVSFKKGMEVDVIFKRTSVWGVKVGNKVGLAPLSFLKETRVVIPTKDLIAVPDEVASEPVSVETTQNDSVDLPMEMTAEMPSGLGSLLSFPSMAAAESVQAQQDNVPSPSSPQYEVVDGTTLWMDPVPLSLGQPAVRYPTDKTEGEAPASENVPVPSPETLPNVVPNSESSTTVASEASSVSQPEVSQNSQEVTEPPNTEVPSTPIPIDSIVTPSSFVENLNIPQEPTADAPQDGTTEALQEVVTEALQEVVTEAPQEVVTEAPQEVVTEAPQEVVTEAPQEVVTEAPQEVLAEAPQEVLAEAPQEVVTGEPQEVVTEAPQEAATEVPQEAAIEVALEADASQEATTEEAIETTESPDDIQPTEAGIMSNIWNTMFNSGDGTEENSQENDAEGEDDEEEGEDEDEGDDDEEDSVEEGSTQANPAVNVSAAPADSVDSATTLSVEDVVQNLAVENVPQVTTASPEELSYSFSQSPNVNLDDKIRSARQTEIFGGEITSAENSLVEDMTQVNNKQQEAAQPPVSSEQNQAVEIESGEDSQQVVDDKLEQEKEELKRQQEAEQKRQQDEEQNRQQEEEQKRRQDEEQKRQQEEEQKRQQEEEQKRQLVEEQKRQQEEEEQKRQQEEEQKRQQEEEQRRQEEEEQKRQQEEAQQKLEEQRREQEEAERRRKDEENHKSIEEEKKLWLQNQEKQRIREEEIKRQRDQAKQKQVQELLEREREKSKVVEEAPLVATEDKQIESASENISSEAEQEKSSEGMFSWFAGIFGSNAESGNTQPEVGTVDQPPVQESQPQIEPALSSPPDQHQHGHPPVWSSEQQTMCSAAEAGCGMTAEAETKLDTSSLFMGIETPSLDVILLRLTATAVALFLGAVSFYFLRKKNVDSSLVAKINELEKQLLVASKEAVILREEASTTLDATVSPEELDYMREELESSRIVRSDLEEQVSTLERELEEATETGIELNKLLSDTLEASKGKAHAGLAASVERLQQQLDSQRDKVDSLTRSLKSTSAENEGLKSLAAESKERVAALEAELAAAADIANNTRREKEEANLLSAQELQQVQSRLEEALSSKVLEESRLGSELSALKLKHETLRSALSMRDSEVKALQETLKELESGETDQLLDVSKVKAEIEHTKKERDIYLVKYQEEEKARKDINERLEKITETLKKLEEKVDVAEKSKEEAETRLTVLSNYFKEKEEQLQKELGLKEAIVAQHRGDESSVIKHLQLLQEEVSTYRAQNESLKQEILDQERDFKGQMATLEKKAHDNWMTARQAERRLEDSRQEAAQLRNRLTHVEKSNADPNARLEANGEGGIASPVMMMPLPHLGDMETPPPLPPFMFSPPPYPPPFMPPPLPPHPMGRPPPLGRMSSPPPPLGQFSPPPPPYDRLDRSSRSRSPSPPPHRYHHRSPPPSQPWDAPPSSFRPVPKPSPKKPNEQREHKGSMHSSGHSNDLADKSREHV